jgi:dienelactone hydrolase
MKCALIFVALLACSSSGYEPPEYAQLDAIEERAVTVGASPWTLPGTLTLPKTHERVPAVVLVHGSGPKDRDGTVGANKPFRDLALGLASHGIAVLRFEKRTKEYAQEVRDRIGDDLTLEKESVEDAIFAVELLQRNDAIDPRRIFVLGHSAGAAAVLRARRERAIRGFLVLAGSTQPLEDVVYQQMDYVVRLDGKISARERTILSEVEAQAARVKALTDGSRVSADALPLGIPVAYWLDLRAHPPERELAREKRPIFVLHGERDYQVTSADLAGWRKLLDSAPNRKIKSYPKLNHLFMEGEGKSTPSEYQTPNHVAGYVIDDIAHFIHAH